MATAGMEGLRTTKVGVDKLDPDPPTPALGSTQAQQYEKYEPCGKMV